MANEAERAAFTLRHWTIAAIAGAGAIYALHEGAVVVVPVLASLLLASALEPLVVRIMRWGAPRLVASILVYLLFTVIVGAVARSLHDDVVAFLDDLPDTIASLKHSFAERDERGPGFVGRLHEAAEEINRAAAARSRPAGSGVQRVTIVRPSFDVRAYLTDAGRGLLAGGARLLVVGVLTFLLLATGDLSKRKLLLLAGPRWPDQQAALDIIRNIDQQIERYLLVRLLISAIVAVATGVALWLLGVANAAGWGLVAGALNVLPFIGPALAVALITVAAFLQFQSIELAAAAGGAALAVAAVEGNFITPLLTSRAGELNTVVVFIAVLFWGWLWGVWGLLLAIPILMAIKAAADRIETLKPVGEMLGR